jgi:hypothetical protein
MLFTETIAIYFENYTKRIKAFRGQNSEFYYVKAGGTYRNREAVRV